jgi:hypothetical protein
MRKLQIANSINELLTSWHFIVSEAACKPNYVLEIEVFSIDSVTLGKKWLHKEPINALWLGWKQDNEGRHFIVSAAGCGCASCERLCWYLWKHRGSRAREMVVLKHTEIILRRMAVQLRRNYPSHICFLGRPKHINSVPAGHDWYSVISVLNCFVFSCNMKHC